MRGLLFPALAIALFPKALIGQSTFFHYDTWMQNLTFRAWWFEQLRDGHFATWCPGLFAGFPLFAETQTGALYPLTFPLFLVLPATLAFSWSVLLHFALAGLGMWLLARRLGAGPAGAVLAGVVYQLSGFLVGHVVHFNLLVGAALVPWALFFAWSAWEGSVRAAVMLAVTIACLLLGAHPYATLMTVLLLAVALVFRTGVGGAMIGGGLGLAAVLLVGTLLAAVQVLPTRELLGRTPRGEAVDYSFLTFGSFPPWHAATLVAPDLFGTPVNGSFWAGPDWSHFAETCAFLGVPTLALAGVALFLRRDLPTRLLATMTSLSFVLMLGKYTPVYRILTWIPLWQSTRLPGRFALLFTLAVALLAGLGLDALRREKSVARRRAALAVGVVPLLLIGGLALSLGAEARSPDAGLELGRAWPAKLETVREHTAEVFSRFGVVMAAGLASLVPFAWRRQPGPVVAAGPIVVIGLDLLTWGSSFNPVVASTVVTEPPPVVAALPAVEPRARVFRQGVDEVWERAAGAPRVDMFTPDWRGNESTYAMGAWTLPPNSQLLYGVDSGEGFTSLIPLQWLEWMGAGARPGATPRPDLTDAQADLLSLDAVISTGSGIAGEGWEPSPLPGGVWISRHADPVPRVRLARSWEVVDRDQLLERVRREDHDARARVLLERGPAGSRTARDGGPVDEPVVAAELGPGTWEIEVPPASDGLVVLSESWDPDWVATGVDGRDLPVLRADGLFVSFFAPSEGGTVTVRHAPRSVRIGAIISVATLLALIGLVVFPRRLRLPAFECRPEGSGRTGNAIPVVIAAAVIAGSWVSHVGNWSGDREASTLSAAAARAWVEEAGAAYAAGALDPAAQLLRAATDRAPRDASILYRLGVVERARGRYNVARTIFERALELDPSMAPARDALRTMSESPR